MNDEEHQEAKVTTARYTSGSRSSRPSSPIFQSSAVETECSVDCRIEKKWYILRLRFLVFFAVHFLPAFRLATPSNRTRIS